MRAQEAGRRLGHERDVCRRGHSRRLRLLPATGGVAPLAETCGRLPGGRRGGRRRGMGLAPRDSSLPGRAHAAGRDLLPLAGAAVRLGACGRHADPARAGTAARTSAGGALCRPASRSISSGGLVHGRPDRRRLPVAGQPRGEPGRRCWWHGFSAGRRECGRDTRDPSPRHHHIAPVARLCAAAAGRGRHVSGHLLARADEQRFAGPMVANGHRALYRSGPAVLRHDQLADHADLALPHGCRRGATALPEPDRRLEREAPAAMGHAAAWPGRRAARWPSCPPPESWR